MTTTICAPIPTYLNEVQFPKELRPPSNRTRRGRPPGLNEVQFPKELRLVVLDTPIPAVHKNATFSHSDVHRGRQANPVRRMFFQPRKRRCVLGFCRTITWSRGSNMGSVHQGRQQPSWRRERLRPAVRCMPVVDTKRKVRGNADRSHQSSCASSVAAARITGLPLTLRTKPSQFRLTA